MEANDIRGAMEVFNLQYREPEVAASENESNSGLAELQSRYDAALAEARDEKA